MTSGCRILAGSAAGMSRGYIGGAVSGRLFAGSPAVGLKAGSSPGALSAPSPEGAPRGVLGTSAEGTVWMSVTTLGYTVTVERNSKVV